MRQINSKLIEETVAYLALKANIVLRADVLSALLKATQKEKNKRTKHIINILIDNANVASDKNLAICQDTGFPVVFIELGQDIHIKGKSLNIAVNSGITKGYRNGCLRKSIVEDPLKRSKPKYTPAVIHIDLVKGSKMKISVLPKGFGCENKAKVKMFNPTVSLDKIKDFIVGVVEQAGADACPPYVIGVGIGGTQDYACLLAKKALLEKITKRASGLEQDLLKEVNMLNIGPMGLGGKTTCLGVNIKSFPTHIAGLPVAVNISCHALRSAAKII